jgi:hypothetical protein
MLVKVGDASVVEIAVRLHCGIKRDLLRCQRYH